MISASSAGGLPAVGFCAAAVIVGAGLTALALRSTSGSCGTQVLVFAAPVQKGDPLYHDG
jgi:hypothetical protein